MEEAKIHSKDPQIETYRYAAAIGYLWILCLLPLMLKKSKFAQFHGKQGLVLLIAWFAVWMVSWIPILGWIIGFFGHMTLFLAMYFGIRGAWRGEYWKMPILGEYAEKIEI